MTKSDAEASAISPIAAMVEMPRSRRVRNSIKTDRAAAAGKARQPNSKSGARATAPDQNRPWLEASSRLPPTSRLATAPNRQIADA
jgi:hypothetical protein